MNRILIISNAASDLSDFILKSCPGSGFVTPAMAEAVMEEYDAVCVLAGNEEGPYQLPAPVRCKLEKMRTLGKPVFTEFVSSVG